MSVLRTSVLRIDHKYSQKKNKKKDDGLPK